MEFTIDIYWDPLTEDHVIFIKRGDLQCFRSSELLREIQSLLQKYILDGKLSQVDPIESRLNYLARNGSEKKIESDYDITTIESLLSECESNRTALSAPVGNFDDRVVSREPLPDYRIDDSEEKTEIDDEQTCANVSSLLDIDNVSTNTCQTVHKPIQDCNCHPSHTLPVIRRWNSFPMSVTVHRPGVSLNGCTCGQSCHCNTEATLTALLVPAIPAIGYPIITSSDIELSTPMRNSPVFASPTMNNTWSLLPPDSVHGRDVLEDLFNLASIIVTHIVPTEHDWASWGKPFLIHMYTCFFQHHDLSVTSAQAIRNTNRLEQRLQKIERSALPLITRKCNFVNMSKMYLNEPRRPERILRKMFQLINDINTESSFFAHHIDFDLHDDSTQDAISLAKYFAPKEIQNVALAFGSSIPPSANTVINDEMILNVLRQLRTLAIDLDEFERMS